MSGAVLNVLQKPYHDTHIDLMKNKNDWAVTEQCMKVFRELVICTGPGDSEHSQPRRITVHGLQKEVVVMHGWFM